ncbi:unnamed protein product [Rangifer tarandus platyrhynchus]|uniref:Uncharacterized protein n=1 Tax=Rangifer tarandus platyrhynchus TaxID=3082113 RepID=A0AC59YTH6_RANTA
MVPLLLLPLLWGGSLQELPGFELRVQESVKVEACMDIRVSCYFSYLWYPWYPSMEPLIYWFREGDSLHVILWPPMTQADERSQSAGADSASSGTPATTTAP